MAITSKTTKTENDGDKPANIPAATEFTPAGAPVQVAGIDGGHPSVDDNPRKDTTVDMNRIDFNEPSAITPPEEAVEKALKGE